MWMTHISSSSYPFTLEMSYFTYAVLLVYKYNSIPCYREQMRLLRRCLWCPPAVRDNNQMWKGEFDTCKSAHCGQLPGWSILLAGTEPERERVSQSGFLIKSIQSFELECYTTLLCIMFPFLGFTGVIDCGDLDISVTVEFKKAELDQSKNNSGTCSGLLVLVCGLMIKLTCWGHVSPPLTMQTFFSLSSPHINRQFKLRAATCFLSR